MLLPDALEEHFSDIISEAPINFSDKTRLLFIDVSFMDIKYPVDSKYSFHWQLKHEIIRIDTAPHHARSLHIHGICILDRSKM